MSQRAEQMKRVLKSGDSARVYGMLVEWFPRGAMLWYQEYDDVARNWEINKAEFFSPPPIPLEASMAFEWMTVQFKEPDTMGNGKEMTRSVEPSDIPDTSPLIIDFYVEFDEDDISPPTRWRVSSAVSDEIHEYVMADPEFSMTSGGTHLVWLEDA